MDKDYFSKVRASESAGKVNAKNKYSSASGLYQFTKGTWEGLGYNWNDRFNPALQEEAMYKYTQNSANQLKKAFGKEPSHADLYGSHFLGAGTYIKALKAGDNTPITNVVSSSAYNANKSVMQKNGKPITVGELKNWLKSKMGEGSGIPSENKEIKQDIRAYITDVDFDTPQQSGIVFTEEEKTPQQEAKQASQELMEDSFKEELEQLQQSQIQQQQEYAQQQAPPIQYDVELNPIEYQPIQQYQEGGEIIKDDNGYWNPANWGKVVEINSPIISMEGVNQNLIGVSKETGERKLMTPNNRYFFKDTKNVIEYPINEK